MMRRITLLLLVLILCIPAISATENNSTDPMDAWHTYNRTLAFKSINGLHDNFSWQYNTSDYPYIQEMSTINESENVAVQMVGKVTTPYKWWVDGPLGSWWYVIAIITITLIVYVMTKQLSAVSVSMILMSALALGSYSEGVIYFAPEAIKTIYIMIVGSLAGVMISAFTQR